MKYLLLTLFSLAVLLLISSKSYSQEDERWIYVGSSIDDNKIMTSNYYDSKTIEYGNNSSVTIWNKSIYDPFKYNTYYNKYMKYLLTKKIYYCKSSKYQDLEQTIYFSDGTTEVLTNPDILKSVLPETIGEAEFNLLCK